jgi:hypothetical protein
MFIEELQRAVTAAPRNDLPRLAEAVWKAHGSGAIGDQEAQGLAEAIEARKVPPTGSRPATGQRRGSRPRSSESLERRRRWVASGKLPPQLAARFTPAETAALSVIAAEIAKHGDCRLPIGALAAIAGICATVVKNAVREARRLGLIEVKERRVAAFRNLPNIVSIASKEWRAWLRLRGGGILATGTSTGSFSSASSRAASTAQRHGEGRKSQVPGHPNWARAGGGT